MSRGIVSVFGGSSPRRGAPAYAEAERLGYLLAENGYTVMTGGYSGVMEAASKGAKSAGGYVIGVTVGLFESAGEHNPNAYNDEIIAYNTLQERISHLVTRCDAAVALHGGIGTLSEVALTWSLLQVGEMKRKPFILLGRGWEDVLTRYYGNGAYIRERDMHLWKAAYTPEEAVALLLEW